MAVSSPYPPRTHDRHCIIPHFPPFSTRAGYLRASARDCPYSRSAGRWLIPSPSSVSAAPASAADLRVASNPVVRIPVAGKTADVLSAEIQAAAEKVCGQPDAAKNGCVAVAVRDANRQLRAINRAGAELGREESVGGRRRSAALDVAGRMNCKSALVLSSGVDAQLAEQLRAELGFALQ